LSKSRVSTRPQHEAKPVISPTTLIGIGVVLAIVIVAVLIFVTNGPGATTGATAKVDDSEFPVQGDPNAPVTMVDFSDYGCPHCQAYKRDTFPSLKKDYIDTGKVKYMVHPFYLGSPDIGKAVEANWCAVEQKKFFEYREVIYQNVEQARTGEAGLVDLAGKVEGLDPAKIQACLTAGTYTNKVETSRMSASRQGVKSTPTFFVNGQKIEGNQPYETMKQIIDRELAKQPNK
jgi:protein-disulfide isomerase